MISSVGPYTLGCDIQSLRGLVELSPSAYLAMPKDFPGERIFKGGAVDFLGREWDIVIGSVEGCIYKLQAQLVSDDAAEFSEVLSATRAYCEGRLGKPAKEKQVGLHTMAIWATNEGNVILGAGGVVSPLEYVNLSLTSTIVVRTKSTAKKKGLLRRIREGFLR
jgi:hypothetical protein